MRAMLDVRPNESALLLGRGVMGRVAEPGCVRVMVVVAPFRLCRSCISHGVEGEADLTHEVICKFKTNDIGIGVLEIDDY